MSAWSLLNLMNLPLSIIQNAFNASFQDKQNKHNEKLVDMQNKAAEKQAEKAYIRSLPSNQMQNMRSAGISDFAAAQAISGGGTYQPSPVNTAQGEAPQIDLNGAMQAISTSMQMKQEMKMQDKLLAAQKSENDANRATQKEIAQLQADTAKYSADSSSAASKYSSDTSARTADDRLNFDKKVYEDAAPLRKRQLEELDSRINNLDAQTNNTKVQTALYDLEYELSAENLDVKKIRNLANDLESITQSQLNILFNESRTNALKALDPAELNLYMQYKMRMELVSLISTAIKDQEWNAPNSDRKLHYLKLIENLVVRK